MREAYKQFKKQISQLKVGSKVMPNLIQVGEQVIGKNNFSVIAGPCAVESYRQMKNIAQTLKSSGVQMLRAGAFKPRTSPYAFQGLGLDGLEILARIKSQYNLAIVTELMNTKHLDDYLQVVDLIQIGSRNMQNFELLKAVGQSNKPVLLKRGFNATVEEFLLAAEYIINEGNPNVILCERGIRSFDNLTRNVLDLSTVAILKTVTRLPVIVDPSHGTGITTIMTPMSLAAKAAGAQGVIVEVHPNPNEALSDKDQALTPEEFSTLFAAVTTNEKETCYG